MIIALRPCLILDAVQRRSGTKSGDKPLAIPVEWLSWLNTKSLLCSKASMHIIHLFAGAIDHDSRIGVSQVPPPLFFVTRHSIF